MTQKSQPSGQALETKALQWLDEGRPFAEAIIVATSGAAPVPVGGRMVIASEEDFFGSVSGGCVEADVIAASGDVIASGKPQTLTFGISEDRAWQSNLPCGATIRVFIARAEPEDARAVASAFTHLRQHRRPCVIATNLTTGTRQIFNDQRNVPEPVAHALRSGQSILIENYGDETFLHAVTPPPRIVAIGATHVAQILEILARAAGYDFVVIDPRSAFTSPSRFAPDTAITTWPDKTLSPYAADIYTAIVTLTHVGHIDDEALKIALNAGCRYIGALGSRRTHAARIERLQNAGFSDAEISRIHAPVGIDLGGRAPGEIAVSILAEIVAAFNSKAVVS